MALLFGAINQASGTQLPGWLHDRLDRMEGRHAGARVFTHGSRASRLLHIDFGHIPGSGVKASETAVTCINGDPLHVGSARGRPSRSVAILHEALVNRDESCFGKCMGVFSGCHVDDQDGSLTLFTDHLGSRPLYVFQGSGFVAFSSIFGFFRTFPPDLQEPDSDGVRDVLSFGFALGSRTPLKHCLALPAAGLLRVRGTEKEMKQYWDWRRVSESTVRGDELLWVLDEAFSEAVRCRIGYVQHQPELAFLSGGMDSRTIVCKLRANGREVQTINVASGETLDSILASQSASAMDIRHRQFSYAGAGTLTEWQQRAVDTVCREGPCQRVVWSGDGGSVGLGAVHLSDRVVRSMRENRARAAVDSFVEENSYSTSQALLSTKHRAEAYASKAVLKELSGVETADPAKALFVFLLLNDQRRHLYAHYERLSPESFEFILPFFDPRLIRLALRAPLDELLYHRLYHRWFVSDKVPGASLSPWQTYPGHVPSIHPPPVGRYQWGRDGGWYSASQRRQLVRRDARQAIVRFLSRGFPLDHFSKAATITRLLLAVAGWRRWRFVAESVRSVYEP